MSDPVLALLIAGMVAIPGVLLALVLRAALLDPEPDDDFQNERVTQPDIHAPNAPRVARADHGLTDRDTTGEEP